MMPLLKSMLLAGASPQADAAPTPPNPQLLAQALDRCMATYAVRLTRTATPDDAIYAQASQGCAALSGQLDTAIKAQLPARQAAEITERLHTSARPNFIAMLTKIRADRAAREGR